MKRHISVLFALIFLSGCVTAGKYKAKEGELAAAQKETADLKNDYASLKTESEKTEQELRARLDAADKQLVSLRKSKKDLQESLDAKKGELTKKVSGLIKERDEISQELAGKERDIEALTRERNLALEAKQAAELAKETELAQLKKNHEDLTASLKSQIASGEITITRLKGKLTVNMVDRILFDSGLAEVKAEGRKVLAQIGSALNDVEDKNIRIEGHTDNIPISGELKNRYPTNWELSTARATAVARYLQDVAKIDPARLAAAGYGEYRPIAANDTPENRALNRRIEIVLVAKD